MTGDTTRSTIFDLDAQKMYTFDSKKKEADVYDLGALQTDMAKSHRRRRAMKAAITPNGTHQDDRRQDRRRLRHGRLGATPRWAATPTWR